MRVSGSARHRIAGAACRWVLQIQYGDAYRFVLGEHPSTAPCTYPELQESQLDRNPRMLRHAMTTIILRSLRAGALFGHFIMGSNGLQSLDRKLVVVGAGDLDKACEQ
jgi:hypothetical protein